MLSATSCAPGTTETGLRTVHDYCLLARPITYSQQGQTQQETAQNLYDTAETVGQAVLHNVTYDRTCPAPTPAPSN